MTLLDKYLELTKDYKFSELYNKWAFLATASACLARRVWLDENALGYLYPNLYVVFVGPPASRKTTTAKLPTDLFLKPMENGPIVCSNQLTPATLIDELRAAGAVKYESKASPLFVLAGEFAVFFKDIGGGSMVDLLLDFYDSRKPGEIWSKHTHKYGKQGMANPALTLLGCTTPKEITQSHLMETAGLGFTSRVIFVCEPRFIPGTTKFPPLDTNLHIQIAKEFARMNSMEGQFTLGPGAEQAIEDIMVRVNRWMFENPGTTLMSNYMARKPTQIRKVAMILSSLRNSKRILQADDVFEAEKLLDGIELTLPEAFGLQIQYRDPALAAKIIDRVPFTGPVTEAQLLHAFSLDGQAIPAGYEWREALDGLVRQGKLNKKGNGENATYSRRLG